MSGPIDDYMTRLERELRRRGIDDPRTLAEAHEHIVDAIDAARQRGLSASDAERDGLERFGAPQIVAAHMLEERNRMAGPFRTALTVAWQRKWWIAVPTVCAAIVAGAMTNFVMAPRYRAEAILLVVPQRVAPDYMRATVIVSIGDQLNRIRAHVMSRTRLERIIEDLGLYQEERERRPLHELVEQMQRNISISMVQGDVFRVSFVSTDRRTAMQVTERLASYLIEENVWDRQSGVEMTSQFLEAQLEEVRGRLRDQETTLDGLRAKNVTGTVSQADLLAFEVLKERYKTLLVQREDARVAENLERRQAGQQIRILERARATPDGPAWPPLTLLGALAGLVIGVILALLPRSGATPPPPTLAEA